MRNKKYSNTLTHHQPKNRQPWYTSQRLILSLYGGSLIVLLISFLIAVGQMAIEPSVLILKNEGCAYLRQYGIPTQSDVIASTCKVDIPFRRNIFGYGGSISYENRRILLADNLIVAVETIKDAPWTPDRKRLMTWIGFCLIFHLAMMFLAFRSLNRKRDSHEHP